ncbi:MAG: hypothetical protein ACR2H0_00095 [Candidatus Limnocylindrales bacterium]
MSTIAAAADFHSDRDGQNDDGEAQCGQDPRIRPVNAEDELVLSADGAFGRGSGVVDGLSRGGQRDRDTEREQPRSTPHLEHLR